MATQATLRFLAKNEGSPGAHLHGMKRQLAKERPLPMHAPGICFFSFFPSSLPVSSIRPSLLSFVRSVTPSFNVPFVRSFVCVG